MATRPRDGPHVREGAARGTGKTTGPAAAEPAAPRDHHPGCGS
ncbi:hypothetical protein [Streptomyces sp. NTH33]|nr:hypothetical protein [Streptomyces sp. NTH33]